MSMEDNYEQIKKAGYNTVDNIIDWLKSANVLQQATESQTREMLSESSKGAKVELEEFQEVIQQVAAENRKQIDEVKEELAKQGPKILEAFEAASKAFADVMNKK